MNVVIQAVGVVYGSCKASHLPERCTERSAVYRYFNIPFHVVSIIVAIVCTAVSAIIADVAVDYTIPYGTILRAGGQAAGRKQQEKCQAAKPLAANSRRNASDSLTTSFITVQRPYFRYSL